jgi:hypothetical protein
VTGADPAAGAVQKNVADSDFKSSSPSCGFWLDKRVKSAFDGVPSTFRNGLLAAK